MRRKLPPHIEPRPTRAGSAVRGLEQAEPLAVPAPGYVAALAAARTMALRAILVVAPLGALAGSVAACGAARPVQADPYRHSSYNDPTRTRDLPAPVSTIAPPSAPPGAPPGAAPSGSATPTDPEPVPAERPTAM